MYLYSYIIHILLSGNSKVSSENVRRTAVQIDFAENYAVKELDEIQSAHWSNKQITVVTGVVWFLNDDTVERRSFALVTDYLGHDFHVFLNNILENIRAETSYHTVHFFSDWAASQMKQTNINTTLLTSRIYMITSNCPLARLCHITW